MCVCAHGYERELVDGLIVFEAAPLSIESSHCLLIGVEWTGLTPALRIRNPSIVVIVVASGDGPCLWCCCCDDMASAVNWCSCACGRTEKRRSGGA